MLVASNAPGFATRSSSANTRFLRSISSNTASITTSASAAASSPTAPSISAMRRSISSRAEPAARDGGAVIGGDPVEPLAQQIVAGLDQGDRDPGIGKAHGDAAAHRAGADHRRPRDRTRLCLGRDARHLRRLALGEKDVPLGLRLIAGDQLLEQLALPPQPFVERQDDGVAHRLDAGGRRLAAAQPPGQVRRSIGKALGHQLIVPVADQPQRPAFGDRPAGKGGCRLDQVARGNFVDDAVGQRLCRPDRLAADDHPQRLFRADQPRQALGPAGAGQQAELDFGQADPRPRRGDPEMAGERQLEAAAQSRAVQRRDHRLCRRFDLADHLAEARGPRRLAEFVDVGAGEKGAPGAGDHHRLDGRVAAGLAQRLRKPGADLVLQRVDRRIVGDDNRNPAVAAKIDAGVDIAHATPVPALPAD